MLQIIIILLFISEVLLSQNFLNNIDTISFKRHVNILGSDLFEGRGTGTKGGELAASYIAKQFKKNGLVPIGDNHTYFQEIPMHGAHFLDDSKLTFYKQDSTVNLSMIDDYLLYNSGEQTIIPKPTELVFVGYGIVAPEYDYNDYIGKDVEGKVAVILSGEPKSKNYNYFNGDEPTIHSYLEIKHRIAISRGALGTIFVLDPDSYSLEKWSKLVIEYLFENVELSYNASDRFAIILNPNSVNKLLELNTDLKFYYALEQSILHSDYKIKFDGKFFLRDFTAKNVVGLIPAINGSEEYIIISAHYDHLGIGLAQNGDMIYNGVLDNAMGVAALIEIGKLLMHYSKNINRSVLLIATTGEEKGLLGSTYYTDNPIVPLHKTVANINIDGISVIEKFSKVIGVGAELSTLKNELKSTCERLGLSITNMPGEFYNYDAFNRSDQIAFALAGIPSILILDAPHYESLSYDEAISRIININQNIYHTPFDDFKQQINFNASAFHTNLLFEFIYDIAISNNKIDWKPQSRYNIMRLQTIAEKR